MPRGHENPEKLRIATVDRGEILNRVQAQLDASIISSLVLDGDMSKLTSTQKVDYYNYRCHQAGLDPAAKPFDLLKLNGKELLYANAACTQQLTSNRNLSVAINDKSRQEDVYIVTCRVTAQDGRYTENTGAVSVKGISGDALANAYMKAHTKAIRRTVLGFCGLGMLDETEVASIPGAVTITEVHEPWSEDDVIEGHKVIEMLRGLASEAYQSDSLAERGVKKYMDRMAQTTFLEWMKEAEAAVVKLRAIIDEASAKAKEEGMPDA